MPNLVVRFIFIFLLIISLFIESSFLAFPFIILISLLFFFFFDDIGTYFIIFVASLFLDSFMLHGIGFTALFLFLFLGILILLDKLFTIKLNGIIMAVIIVLGVEGYRQYASYPLLFMPEAFLLITLLSGLFIQKRMVQKGGLLGAQAQH